MALSLAAEQQNSNRAAQLLVTAAALSMAWLPLPAAAIAALLCAALTLVWHDPIWAVVLAVVSVPFQDLALLPGGLTLTQAVLPLVLLSLLRHGRAAVLDRSAAAFALFLWVLTLSAAFSPYSHQNGVVQTARWGVVALVYLAARAALDGPADRQRALPLIAAILTAAVGSALLGIVQYRFGLGPESFAIAADRSRAFGLFGQPNSYAGYLNHGWPLALGLLLGAVLNPAGDGRRKRRHALLPAAAAVLIAAGLYVSFSRGGWLGALLGLAAAALLGLWLLTPERRGVAVQRLTGAALIVGTALLLPGAVGALPAALTARVQSLISALQPLDIRNIDITDANFAVVERTAQMQTAAAMVAERPWLGVGPGNYDTAYQRGDRPDQPAFWIRPWATPRGHAHNYYLHISAEAGLIGLAAYLGLTGTLVQRMLQRLRSERDALGRGCALGGLIMIATVGGHNLFENLHVLNIGIQFAAVAALAATRPWSSGEGVQA